MRVLAKSYLVLLAFLLLPLSLAHASEGCPETALEIFEESKAVLWVESLNASMSNDEFYAAFFGDSTEVSVEEKYNKEWFEYFKSNSNAELLVKKVYKGNVAFGDVITVSSALAEFDFIPSYDYIVFLEPNSHDIPYSLNTCLVVDHGDLLIRWYAYDGDDEQAKKLLLDSDQFKLLVSGLGKKDDSKERSHYLKSVKFPDTSVKVKLDAVVQP